MINIWKEKILIIDNSEKKKKKQSNKWWKSKKYHSWSPVIFKKNGNMSCGAITSNTRHFFPMKRKNCSWKIYEPKARKKLLFGHMCTIFILLFFECLFYSFQCKKGLNIERILTQFLNYFLRILLLLIINNIIIFYYIMLFIIIIFDWQSI